MSNTPFMVFEKLYESINEEVNKLDLELNELNKIPRVKMLARENLKQMYQSLNTIKRLLGK